MKKERKKSNLIICDMVKKMWHGKKNQIRFRRRGKKKGKKTNLSDFKKRKQTPVCFQGKK